MRIIGVTGGVGSGKSAVLNYIEEHFDSRIVKADDVGHLLMMPGRACYEPVIQLFGEWIVKDDTSLNREAIASIVFEDGEMLKKLDDIIHPAVKKYILKEIEKSKKKRQNFSLLSQLCCWKKNMMKFVMRCGIFIAKKKYVWSDCVMTEDIPMRKFSA